MAHRLLPTLAHALVKNSKAIVIGVITVGSISMTASAFVSIKSHPTLKITPLSYEAKKKTPSPSPAITPTTETVPDDETQPQQVSSARQPTKSERTTKRRGDSTNPDWLACQAKLNDLYVAYNANIARANQEKNAALAEIDRMYEDGELAYDPDGNYLEPYQQTNAWQVARDIITDEYDSQLLAINQDHQAKWSAQFAACELTYDH